MSRIGTERKAFLLGRVCPVFVADPERENYTYRPRLWGYLTIGLVVWYCNLRRIGRPLAYPTGG